MRATTLVLAVFGGIVLLLPEANAQQQQQQMAPMTNRPTMNIGDWYGGLEGGVFIPNDLSITEKGVIGGVASSITGTLSFDSGPAVGGFVGYHFNDYLAGEAEFLYGSADIDRLTATVTGIATGSGSLRVNGSIDTETFLANAI